jgi:hypothetical protein
MITSTLTATSHKGAALSPGGFQTANRSAGLFAADGRDAGAQLWPIQFPALAALPLTDEDRAALERQGFVQAEHRGERTVYKLRYRVHRRQVVRCLSNTAAAAAVEEELARLQASRQCELQLSRGCKRANRLIRESKRVLSPVVEAAGMKFHGLRLRRPRKPATQR